MLTCLVLWCGNKGNVPGIHYFYLTRARHDIWMRALGRDPNVERLSYKNVICSNHFSPNDLYTKCSRMFLRKNAVPRLLLRKNNWDSNQKRILQELHSNEIQTVNPYDHLEVLFAENKEDCTGVNLRICCTPTIEIAESVTNSSTDSPRSFKRSHKDTSTDSERNKELKRVKREVKIRHNYCVSPSHLSRKLKVANVGKILAQRKVKAMKVKVDRLKMRVANLKQIIRRLKRKELVSKNGGKCWKNLGLKRSKSHKSES